MHEYATRYQLIILPRFSLTRSVGPLFCPPPHSSAYPDLVLLLSLVLVSFPSVSPSYGDVPSPSNTSGVQTHSLNLTTLMTGHATRGLEGNFFWRREGRKFSISLYRLFNSSFAGCAFFKAALFSSSGYPGLSHLRVSCVHEIYPQPSLLCQLKDYMVAADPLSQAKECARQIIREKKETSKGAQNLAV